MSADNDNSDDGIEVKDFYYKQMRKLRVFKSTDVVTVRSSLLAVSNEYGVVYVAGEDKCISAIKVETVEKIFVEVQGSLQVEETAFPSATINVGHSFSNIALSCNDLTLAVGYRSQNTPAVGFLDVKAFFSNKSPKKFFAEIPFPGNEMVSVVQLAWNPTSPEILAVLLSDGQILMVTLNGVQADIIAALRTSATAVSWSPKGKQIVAGLKNGMLVQYKPDLQMKKEIPFPDVLTNPCQVTDVVWISTFLFGVVYTECDDNEVSSLVIVNSPKTGAPFYEVFDDVYYSLGEDREPCFYLNYISQWKLVLSLYSCSYELVTISQTDKGPWVKWILPDSGQATLPSTHDNEDTYPLGLALSFSVTKSLEQDGQKFPPAPILFLLTTDGVLCPFYMIYKNPQLANDVCHLPKPLPLDGERLSSSTASEKKAVVKMMLLMEKIDHLLRQNILFHSTYQLLTDQQAIAREHYLLKCGLQLIILCLFVHSVFTGTFIPLNNVREVSTNQLTCLLTC